MKFIGRGWIYNTRYLYVGTCALFLHHHHRHQSEKLDVRTPRFFNSAVVSVVWSRALIAIMCARTTYTNPRSTATRVFKSGICVPTVRRRRRRLRCDSNTTNRRGHFHRQGMGFIFLSISFLRTSVVK